MQETNDTMPTQLVTKDSFNGTSALDIQVDGNHYKNLKIQPVEYISANNLGYFEGNVIKYVTRWRAKNGIKDLEKAKHYIDLLIELEQAKQNVEYQQEAIADLKTYF